MASFKFSFDLSSSLPEQQQQQQEEQEKSGEHSVQGSRGQKNGLMNSTENSSTSNDVSNNKNDSANNKPIQIERLNVRNYLSRLIVPIKDWNYNEIDLKQSDQQQHDPLRRVNLKESPFYNNKQVATGDVKNQERHVLEQEKTDIIKGVYEGGLKVWECSIDLCQHLAEEVSKLNDQDKDLHNDVFHAIQKDNGSTLELGCGHGLPGCLILRQLLLKEGKRNQQSDSTDSPIVLFSDYNDFVLHDVTVPSILLNTLTPLRSSSEEEINEEFVNSITYLASGDWMELSQEWQRLSAVETFTERNEELGQLSESSSLLPSPSSPQNDRDSRRSNINNDHDGRFDLILGAEITYSTSSTMDTVKLLLRHLKVNTGIGLIATKRYYFGVGGGTDIFREAALKETICVTTSNGNSEDETEITTYGLVIECIKEYDSGKANIRDLLRVRCVER